MPELPEVETVRRGLEPVMEGARIVAVDMNRPDLRFPFPENFQARLTGRTITALSRRAKYMLVHLDDHAVLICHLGMSGSFRVEDDEGFSAVPAQFHRARSRDQKHDHAVFHLQKDGLSRRVVFNDPRRFGFMALSDEASLAEHPLLAGLGAEPTGNSLSGALLGQRLFGKRTSIKAALMDQRIIAGLGNIYVCEALWRAGISPRRSAASVAGASGRPSKRSERLADAVRAVIADAVAAGGSSLRDYMRADGSLGYFQHSFAVYDREGEPCAKPGCEGTVRRIVQAGRSTFYCPTCQR